MPIESDFFISGLVTNPDPHSKDCPTTWLVSEKFRSDVTLLQPPLPRGICSRSRLRKSAAKSRGVIDMTKRWKLRIVRKWSGDQGGVLREEWCEPFLTDHRLSSDQLLKSGARSLAIGIEVQEETERRSLPLPSGRADDRQSTGGVGFPAKIAHRLAEVCDLEDPPSRRPLRPERAIEEKRQSR